METPARLLVVDDDLPTLELLKLQLARQGYEVLAYRLGADALPAIESERFDVAILDVMLPDVSGYDLCRKIKDQNRTRGIPVMMLTGLREANEKIKGLDIGADEFLIKPFQEEEMLARVRAMLRISRLTQALERSLEEVTRLQELKTQLYRYVVHDLRGPMTSISGALEMLSDADDPTGARWLVGKARLGCDAIMELILTLMDIDRMDRGELSFEKRPMDCAEMIREAVEQWVPLGEARRVSVILDLPPGPVTLTADRSYLKRAIGNLLANAIRYSPQGETIRVRLKPQPPSSLRIEIEDRGPGVPRDLAEKVFLPGYSYSAPEGRSHRGFGLGLALCRIVARGHGGDAWVEENKPSGARFVLSFPA